MSKQYQIPGGPFVNLPEDGVEYQIAGYGYLNQATTSSGLPGTLGCQFFGGSFFNGGFFCTPATTDVVKTGTGGIDPGEGLKRRPFKPTGLLDRPKAKDALVQERLDDAVDVQAEIASQLAREFGEETQRIEAKNIVEMTMAEVDFEIGVLLRKKLRTEEDEIMLMLLMVAASEC